MGEDRLDLGDARPGDSFPFGILFDLAQREPCLVRDIGAPRAPLRLATHAQIQERAGSGIEALALLERSTRIVITSLFHPGSCLNEQRRGGL
jgi:hypothetical protein